MFPSLSPLPRPFLFFPSLLSLAARVMGTCRVAEYGIFLRPPRCRPPAFGLRPNFRRHRASAELQISAYPSGQLVDRLPPSPLTLVYRFCLFDHIPFSIFLPVHAHIRTPSRPPASPGHAFTISFCSSTQSPRADVNHPLLHIMSISALAC